MQKRKMLWNYIKISFRKFTRQKFYSLLNMLGLATGMGQVPGACCQVPDCSLTP
jgi:hypothetical protein